MQDWPQMMEILALSPLLDEELTSTRLWEVWQRASDAPPGTWHVVADGRGRCVVHPQDLRQPAEASAGLNPEAARAEAQPGRPAEAGAAEAACHLIAHARDDLLAVIAEVVRLHAQLERLSTPRGRE